MLVARQSTNDDQRPAFGGHVPFGIYRGQTLTEWVAFGRLGGCGEQGRKSDHDRSNVSHGRDSTPRPQITAMHRPHDWLEVT